MSLFEGMWKAFRPQKKQQRLMKVVHAIETFMVDQQAQGLDRDRDLDWEYEHMHEAIRWAKILAAHRKINTDLAACAVATQNVGRIATGKTDGHAEAGYDVAKRLFSALGCFTPAEIAQLSSAVGNHSRKDAVDAPLDELAKDVDVYVRYLQGHEFSTPHEIRRLSAVRLELQKKIS